MKTLTQRMLAPLALSLGFMGVAPNAQAQMIDQFVGQISCVGFNFTMQGWQALDGSLLSIDNYPALYSLIGTTYGGDGITTFAVPDMRGRALMVAGNGAGLPPQALGSTGGAETMTLTASQLPSHTHNAPLQASTAAASLASPAGAVLPTGNTARYVSAPADRPMATLAMTTTGSASPAPVPTMPPFVTLNCQIATEGIFPSRP